MIASRGSDLICPICSQGELSDLEENFKTCSDCSVVLSKSELSLGDQVVRLEDVSTNSGATGEAWRESVTVKDSSEQALVDLIADTESIVRALDGDKTDCIYTAEKTVEAWEQGLFTGRKREVVIGAIIYSVFREQGRPRPQGIVADVVNIPIHELRKICRAFSQRSKTEITVPSDYIPYLASHLSIDEKTQNHANQLLDNLSDVAGNPAGIAAAALYLAARQSDQAITLVAAGSAAGLSKETVWVRTREIRDSLQSNIDDNMY